MPFYARCDCCVVRTRLFAIYFKFNFISFTYRCCRVSLLDATPLKAKSQSANRAVGRLSNCHSTVIMHRFYHRVTGWRRCRRIAHTSDWRTGDITVVYSDPTKPICLSPLHKVNYRVRLRGDALLFAEATVLMLKEVVTSVWRERTCCI